MRSSSVCAWVIVAGVVFSSWTSGVARGQEEPKPDELKKMYDDALVGLKAAQDRKNELGVENEKLKARVAELEKQLQEKQSRLDTLEADASEYAENTYHLRASHAAWKQFLSRYPALEARWRVFLENQLLTVPNPMPDVVDPEWPLSAQG